MMKRYTHRMLLLAVMLTVSACSVPARSTSTLVIENAWARPVTVAAASTAADAAGAEGTTSAPPSSSATMDHGGAHAADAAPSAVASGVTGGAYLTIRNTGSAADQLLRVTTDVADVVELHTTVIDNNVAQMRPIATIDVPANGQVEFKSGSYHLMLVNVKHTLEAGDTVPLTLTFQNVGDIEVRAEVRAS